MTNDNEIKINVDEILQEIALNNNVTVEEVTSSILDVLNLIWLGGKLQKYGFTEKPSINEFLVFFLKESIRL